LSEKPIVYLVDDDSIVRKAIALSLGQAGLSVKDYGSAKTFLEEYREDEAGCLVLDLRMPDMDGLALQQILNDKESDIPVIFISGDGDIPTSVRAIKRGAVDFLEKPFTREVLLNRVEEAMERYRLRNEEEAAREERCHLLGQLTTRERETLVLVVKGKTNKEIARELDISFRTVEKYRASLMGKLGVQRFAELVTLGKECLEELAAKGVA
jgi:FixJ family two-component response regulator